MLIVWLLVAQLCLGFLAFITRVAWGQDAVQPELPMVISTVSHVAVGALLLATSVVLAIQVWRHVPVAFAELHCHSNFSFLDGASSVEDLVERALEVGLTSLALTDHQGLYGAVRFASTAHEAGLNAIVVPGTLRDSLSLGFSSVC
jgi:hypothetical protein